MREAAVADCSFPKQSRLLEAIEYKAVFDNAQFKVSNRYFLFLAIPGEGVGPRLGLVIAKKHVPKAVQRNRLKRKIRERFRLLKPELGTLDVVVLARKGADNLSSVQISKNLDQLWHDLSTRFSTFTGNANSGK